MAVSSHWRSLLHRVGSYSRSGRGAEEQVASWQHLLSWCWVFGWEHPLTGEGWYCRCLQLSTDSVFVFLSSVFWGHAVGRVASRLAEKKTRLHWGAGGGHRPQEDLQTGAVRQVGQVFTHRCSIHVWSGSIFSSSAWHPPLLTAGWLSWRRVRPRTSWGRPTSTSWKLLRTTSCYRDSPLSAGTRHHGKKPPWLLTLTGMEVSLPQYFIFWREEKRRVCLRVF